MISTGRTGGGHRYKREAREPACLYIESFNRNAKKQKKKTVLAQFKFQANLCCQQLAGQRERNSREPTAPKSEEGGRKPTTYNRQGTRSGTQK